jgi:hypothetical protein
MFQQNMCSFMCYRMCVYVEIWQLNMQIWGQLYKLQIWLRRIRMFKECKIHNILTHTHMKT